MTKTTFSSLALVAALASFAVACSSGDGEISVEAAKAPLSDNGGDETFTLTIASAPEDGYALDAITVKAKAGDKDAIALTCTVNDANTNQKLDKGDSVTCKEGETNVLGADLAGSDIVVELHAKVDGEEKLVAEATWTAASK